jgi:hypothetical protein
MIPMQHLERFASRHISKIDSAVTITGWHTILTGMPGTDESAFVISRA